MYYSVPSRHRLEDSQFSSFYFELEHRLLWAEANTKSKQIDQLMDKSQFGVCTLRTKRPLSEGGVQNTALKGRTKPASLVTTRDQPGSVFFKASC